MPRKLTATCPITGERTAWKDTESPTAGEPSIVLDELPDGLPVGWGNVSMTMVAHNPDYARVMDERERARAEFEAQLAALQADGQMGDDATADLARAQYEGQLDASHPIPPPVVYVEWEWNDCSPDGMVAIFEAMKAAGIPVMTIEEAFPEDDDEDFADDDEDAPPAEGEASADAAQEQQPAADSA